MSLVCVSKQRYGTHYGIKTLVRFPSANLDQFGLIRYRISYIYVSKQLFWTTMVGKKPSNQTVREVESAQQQSLSSFSR